MLDKTFVLEEVMIDAKIHDTTSLISLRNKSDIISRDSTACLVFSVDKKIHMTTRLRVMLKVIENV